MSSQDQTGQSSESDSERPGVQHSIAPQDSPDPPTTVVDKLTKYTPEWVKLGAGLFAFGRFLVFNVLGMH